MAEHIEETDIASFTRSCRHLGIGLRQLGVSSQDVAWEIIQNCLQRRLHFAGSRVLRARHFIALIPTSSCSHVMSRFS